MRISDWSSDVCSSDLAPDVPESPIETDRGKAKIFETIPNLSGAHFTIRIVIENVAPTGCESEIVGKPVRNFGIDENFGSAGLKIGRASCRERVCPIVWISVVAVTVKKKNKII